MHSASPDTPKGRGVIVFRNYIHAASIAYAQRATLNEANHGSGADVGDARRPCRIQGGRAQSRGARVAASRVPRRCATGHELLGEPVGGVDPAAEIRRVLADEFWSKP